MEDNICFIKKDKKYIKESNTNISSSIQKDLMPNDHRFSEHIRDTAYGKNGKNRHGTKLSDMVNPRELGSALDEIYARRMQSLDDYKEIYFIQQLWYEGAIDEDEFDDGLLSDTERYDTGFLYT